MMSPQPLRKQAKKFYGPVRVKLGIVGDNDFAESMASEFRRPNVFEIPREIM